MLAILHKFTLLCRIVLYLFFYSIHRFTTLREEVPLEHAAKKAPLLLPLPQPFFGRKLARPIIFMAVTTHANPGSYRHQQLSERLFSSGSLSRIRDQGGERRTSGSDQLQTSYNQRKMTNTVRASNKAAILAVGEELRLLLREEDPPLIKDRRYHLRVYQECFVGHEMVDWLLKKGEVESRKEAVAMMQKLLDHGVIHHGERESS